MTFSERRAYYCPYCGYPIDRQDFFRLVDRDMDDPVDVRHVCPGEPAYAEVAALRAQIGEAERRLKSRAEEALLRVGGAEAWRAYRMSLKLLQEALAGKLKIGGDKE